jgi:hypothetical protein
MSPDVYTAAKTPLRLEPISKSPEEDNEAGELNKAQEKDSALPLDPSEEALNEPAAHIAGYTKPLSG